MQLPGSDRHLRHLVAALRAQAGPTDFRALVAFMTLGNLTKRLLGSLDKYCLAGGRIDWVVGCDLGGTHPDALRRLLRLQEKYPANRIRIIRLAGRAIFHPKFYWLASAQRHLALLGSANCTGGGLGNNLEISAGVDVRSSDRRFAAVGQMLADVWASVDRRRGVVAAARLEPLDAKLIARVKRFRSQSRAHRGPPPPHPVAPPRKPGRAKRRGSRSPWLRGAGLLMELTLEQGVGRETQVQPPKPAWEGYFHVDLRKPGRVSLRRQASREAYRSRPIVRHHHNWTIELPGAEMPRPALVRFRRTGPRQYVYRVVRPNDVAYRGLRRLLDAAHNPHRRGGRGRKWLVS